MNDFASKLSYYRALSGLTQSELAGKVGITTAQISRYETGNAIPRPKVRDLLAEALKVEPSDLTPIIDKQWSNEVKTKMRQLKISQSDLAEKLEVNQSSLANWLNGLRTPKEEIIKKISSILGLQYTLNNKLQSELPMIKGWFSQGMTYPLRLTIKATSKHRTKEILFNLTPSESQELKKEIKEAIYKYLSNSGNDVGYPFLPIVNQIELSDIKLTFKSDGDNLPE